MTFYCSGGRMCLGLTACMFHASIGDEREHQQLGRNYVAKARNSFEKFPILFQAIALAYSILYTLP